MITAKPSEYQSNFCPSEIEEQLEKILQDEHFIESRILSKFLSFIVKETISGRSDCLKEYTIATNVLGKPTHFKPQENGIVRIHAGRLRRMLNHYYETIGNNDEIIFSIPKGNYVPIFSSRVTDSEEKLDFTLAGRSAKQNSQEPLASFAILPFAVSSSNEMVNSFAEGLCSQINTNLMAVRQISVVAHSALRYLAGKNLDWHEISVIAGFNHIMTGSVQYVRDRVRISIEISKCESYRQVWADTFERHLSEANLFEVQDELCDLLIGRVKEFFSEGNDMEENLAVLSAV
ncbi:MAG: hypothetical protein C5B52_05280 [Bacteroidetes bacterium]|nr:MAG: hypothetical protein C5B52_05280 [Bacteroidota bacterium]